MPNNESSGNDGTTKTFWDELKTSLLVSINKAFEIWERFFKNKP